jgi:hypothetical protein
MFNATATRTLMGVMLLVCAPAMAIIPPAVDIRLGGAEPFGDFQYAVRAGDVVSLAVTAQPGDLIWAFAVPLNEDGEADYSVHVTLLLDRDAVTGKVSGDFVVPAGLDGRRFQIEALARSDDGEISESTTVIVNVLSLRDPNDGAGQ